MGAQRSSKLECSKPLTVDSASKLVDIHQNDSASCPSPQEVNQIDAITLNLTMNLRDSQRADPHLAYTLLT